jgi:catechol 2,3-dioxygenase-like lactoylglutathione lyase family enzyme
MTAPQQKSGFDALDRVAVSVQNIEESVNWYTSRFQCRVVYQDATGALLEFGNVRLAFVIPAQHPPHIAILGDPRSYGLPVSHRDGTSSVYIQDPNGAHVEILELAKT